MATPSPGREWTAQRRLERAEALGADQRRFRELIAHRLRRPEPQELADALAGEQALRAGDSPPAEHPSDPAGC